MLCREILPPPLKPYDYQVPIIKNMVSTILEGKNGLVIQPTATGKSIESAFVSRACILLYKMKGLYLYDENEGLIQAREKCEYIFNKNNIVCANFFGYGKDHFVDNADMVFASFQSLNNHCEKWYQMFDQKHFGFIIVNEGHHSQAVTYKEVIDYFDCPKIGMTATPNRMDGKDILDIFDQKIIEITLPEAIVKGWVAKVDYHILSHNISTQRLKKICQEVLEDGMRISIKQLNETIFIEALDEVVIEEIYKYSFPKDSNPRQTLIFCENIRHANHMFNLLEKDEKSVEVIHSHKSKSHNRSTMQSFRENKIQFLISVDKLNEDIDVPNVEVGVFLRATDSETVFFQQLGRLLRNQIKHTAIVLDFVANVDRLIIVKELMKKIEELTKINGIPLTKDCFYVSGEGFDFNLTDQVVDVLKILEAISVGKYKTWQEASKAAQKLGIKSLRMYFKLYKKDLMLPGNPCIYYPDFPGCLKFFNTEKYATWQEASKVVVSMGIKIYAEYQKLYKKDPMLASRPDEYYSDFPGWLTYFGGAEKYNTWQEASIAAKTLKIKGYNNFRLRYKEDPQLSSNPDEKYSDFPGWQVFLGKI